jgi:hypothetical protein
MRVGVVADIAKGIKTATNSNKRPLKVTGINLYILVVLMILAITADYEKRPSHHRSS